MNSNYNIELTRLGMIINDVQIKILKHLEQGGSVDDDYVLMQKERVEKAFIGEYEVLD